MPQKERRRASRKAVSRTVLEVGHQLKTGSDAVHYAPGGAHRCADRREDSVHGGARISGGKPRGHSRSGRRCAPSHAPHQKSPPSGHRRWPRIVKVGLPLRSRSPTFLSIGPTRKKDQCGIAICTPTIIYYNHIVHMAKPPPHVFPPPEAPMERRSRAARRPTASRAVPRRPRRAAVPAREADGIRTRLHRRRRQV